MFRVHNTNRTLKYQGMGPYHMVETTPQGSVQITMLDEVVMEGYNIGSKLIRFNGTLSLETLQAIHQDNECKKEQ